MVTHSAASAKGSEINTYLRFKYRASTFAGKQCRLYAVRLQKTCDRRYSVVDTCGLVLRLQTRRSITNGRSEKGPKYHTRQPADRSEVSA